MMDAELTPYGERPPPPGLAELRVRAEDLAKDERWSDLLDLRDELEADRECWVSLWAPLLAIAARQCDLPEAWDLLNAAADAGFRQRWIFDGLLERSFGSDPGWPDLRGRIDGPCPPPPVELLNWPTAPAMWPLALDRVPGGRDDELAVRLPPPEPTAWGTALVLLEWVAKRWNHSNDHVHHADALEILDRVDKQAARFACVEYSIVLCQALNAVGIPARRLSLRAADHHTGLGRGHVVSEAWIDELSSWVLLDGQNGSFWIDGDDHPLGILDLQRHYNEGHVSRFVAASGEQSEADAGAWHRYFAHASTTGVGWTTGSFAPTFQDVDIVQTARLLHGSEGVAPDLARLWTGVVREPHGGEPALTFTPVHPYATGVEVRPIDGDPDPIPIDGIWPIPADVGRHEFQVATTTPYAVLTPADLVLVRR